MLTVDEAGREERGGRGREEREKGREKGGERGGERKAGEREKRGRRGKVRIRTRGGIKVYEVEHLL